MVDKQELLFVVDEFDVALTPQPRHRVFKKGLWRRCVHVWIINDKNQILCQKRSMLKDISPGMWEPAVTGHIGPSDNYFSGAARELLEETGINVSPKDLELVKIYKADRFKEYRGIFLYKWNGDIQDIKREENEVDEVKFIGLKTLKKHLIHEKDSNWCLPGYEEELFRLIS